MTLSGEYREQLQKLHAEHDGWGSTAHSKASDILARLEGNVILDYGCGKGTLKKAMSDLRDDVEVVEYDPGIPGKDSVPDRHYDLVVAVDVMEHIEPDYLEDVLKDIAHHARNGGIWLLIHTRPAGARLPDGRNAHLIQEGLEWWTDKLEPHFPGHKIQWTSNGVWLRVTWRRSNYASTENTPIHNIG